MLNIEHLKDYCGKKMDNSLMIINKLGKKDTELPFKITEIIEFNNGKTKEVDFNDDGPKVKNDKSKIKLREFLMTIKKNEFLIEFIKKKLGFDFDNSIKEFIKSQNYQDLNDFYKEIKRYMGFIKIKKIKIFFFKEKICYFRKKDSKCIVDYYNKHTVYANVFILTPAFYSYVIETSQDESFKKLLTDFFKDSNKSNLSLNEYCDIKFKEIIKDTRSIEEKVEELNNKVEKRRLEILSRYS